MLRFVIEGKLEAHSASGHNDSGVAIGSSVATVPNILYPGVPKQIQDWDVVTNGPAGMAFRGPGGPAGLWALEQAIDALAIRRGIDPLEYRKANDSDPVRQRLFAWVAQQELWKLRSTVPRQDGEWLIGVGMATSAHVHSQPSLVGASCNHLHRRNCPEPSEPRYVSVRKLHCAAVAESLAWIDLG